MTYSEAYARSIADTYDAVYAVVRDPSGDAAFYERLAIDAGGPVLELGCGTGRVILPIARRGVACVGLDASSAMLDVLRAKGPPENLETVCAEASRYDLGAGRFKLIFAAFRVFQHFYTVNEQLEVLACAKRHLAPGGLLAFDVFAPLLERIALAEEPWTQDATAREGDDEVRRFAAVQRDHAAQVQTVRFRHERWRDGARLSEETSEIRMRWFYRYEVEHLLVRAGFEPVSFLGGYDGRPYDGHGDIIAIARASG